MMSRLLARCSVALIAAAGVVVACHDNVPHPTLPLTPEVGPQAPRPKPIEPIPIRIDHDAGIPLPGNPEPSAARTSRSAPRRMAHAMLGFAQAPSPDARGPDAMPLDAAVPVDADEMPADVIDLPPVMDADVPIVRDAAQPYR